MPQDAIPPLKAGPSAAYAPTDLAEEPKSGHLRLGNASTDRPRWPVAFGFGPRRPVTNGSIVRMRMAGVVERRRCPRLAIGPDREVLATLEGQTDDLTTLRLHPFAHGKFSRR